MVRVDLRGHGASPASPPPYTLELLQHDLIDVISALELGRCSIMGVSIGGILALGLALEAPELVERIIVADCRADAPQPYVAMWDDSIATVERAGLEPVIESSVERWFSSTFRELNPDVVSQVRERALATSVDGFIGCARAVQGLALLDRLHDISTPSLFMVGSEDPAAPPEVMREMARRVAGSELVEIPGAGHLTPVEAPEAYLDAVLAFLDRDRR